MPGAAENARALGSWLLVALATMGLASEAAAGLFRCVRPDGSVLYTDSEASCPGAKPHEPAAAIQSYPSHDSPRVNTPASVRKRNERRRRASEASMRAEWVAKQREAQRDLEAAEAKRKDLLPYVTVCNRGGTLYVQRSNGMRTDFSCDDLKRQVAELEGEKQKLHAYLNGGLQAECRKAGCLPGWLRGR